MSQVDKANHLKALHVAGRPLVLYNIWDAGGARTVATSGAQAIATGSWSVAAAHGYADGEEMPFDFALQIVARIAQSTDLPLTVDFEGGYATTAPGIAANAARVIAAGAVGINFEDQVVKGDGLYPVAAQVERIRAIRQAADHAGLPLFINARTDVFLRADGGHAALMAEAERRRDACVAAGADGFFVPGLTDETLIARLCAGTTVPVNVMMTGELSSLAGVARLGVARVSFGPLPFLDAQQDLAARLGDIFSEREG